MMNYLRRAAQWAGGVGSPALANRIGGTGQVGSAADGVGEIVNTAGEGRLTRGLMAGPRDRNMLAGAQSANRTQAAADISQRMQRRGAKRIAAAEGTRQILGFGPLTIGSSSGGTGVPPAHSSGGMALPPPPAGGPPPGAPPTV